MDIKYVLDCNLNFAQVGGVHVQDSGVNLLHLL